MSSRSGRPKPTMTKLGRKHSAPNVFDALNKHVEPVVHHYDTATPHQLCSSSFRGRNTLLRLSATIIKQDFFLTSSHASPPRIRVESVSRVSHQIVSKSQAHLRVVRFLIFALRQHMIRPRVPLSQPYRNPSFILNI